MKNFKGYIKIFLALLFLLQCQVPCMGQATKAGKSIIKWFGKVGTKETGEVVAEKTVKEISSEMVDYAIKRNVANSVHKETSEVVSDKIFKEITSDRIDNVISRRVANELGEKGLFLTGKSLKGAVIDKTVTETRRNLLEHLGTPQSYQKYLDAAKHNFKKQTSVKAAGRGALKATGKSVLKTIDDVPGMAEVVKTLQQKFPSFTDDILSIERLGNTRKLKFNGTATEIIIDSKGHFHCTSGSTMTRGAMNEFLNHPIPNARYYVDNGLTQFATDMYGRTTQIECHSSDLFKSVQRNKLASSQRDELRRLKGGVQGIDDAGHIQAHATGGSNELYNLLPMNKEMQRQGSKWAKMEQEELNAIKRGDDVWSKKTISYNLDGSYKIDVELKITDATSHKTKTIRKSFDDLYRPDQKHQVKKVNTQTIDNPPIKQRKYRVPSNKNGHWTGPRGDSEYILDPDRIPSTNTYDNPLGKTVRELGKDLNDPNPSVLFKNGYPVFDRDGGTATGKPLQVTINEGIEKFIDKDEVIRKNGKNINRQNLHEEAYKRMAEELGISVDVLKVFKGDDAAAKRLADEWGCSLDEVYRRCDNPNRIQRVLHECEDGKTIQLVPRLYHYSGMVHNGGIEKVVSEILSNA